MLLRRRGRIERSAHEREEAAHLFVVAFDVAGHDVVVPAVDLQAAFDEGLCNGWLAAQLRSYDVAANERI